MYTINILHITYEINAKNTTKKKTDKLEKSERKISA